MGTRKRKYYFSENGGIKSSNTKSFLVFWKEEEKKPRTSSSEGPFLNYRDAEKIMVEHLIKGVCSWIVSYNG